MIEAVLDELVRAVIGKTQRGELKSYRDDLW